VVATDNVAPYELDYLLDTQGTVFVEAKAYDPAGNEGSAQAVSILVTEDPGTTVIGQVLDRDDNLLSGAEVNCLGKTGVTDISGDFNIVDVPTIQTQLICTASYFDQIDQVSRNGRSAVTDIVRDGTTNVGTIRISSGKVGILAADQIVHQQIIDFLVGTGVYSPDDISIIDVRNAGLTLLQLSEFDSVLVWSNYQFYNSVELGNMLADYVDQGGGVVLATFGLYSSWTIRGRMLDEGYSPFLSSGSTTGCNLDTSISDMSHPILQGYISFNSSFCYGGSVLASGATVIAYSTTNGQLVGVNAANNIVAFNLFPNPQYGASQNEWNLFVNALQFVQ
jgi:hypothetical protein